jgi:hypothetical protein
MSETRAIQHVGGGIGRIIRAWGRLPYERRLAAAAAIGLFVTLFLPWYQETVIAKGNATSLQSASASVTGWGAFSFVEAAVLLVAFGVLTLLFQRAEGRAFHLPGGDGGVITAAGLWTCVLVVWRIFDKQSTSSHGQFATTSGIEWGIFITLAVAAFLAYAGSRIRAAHRPEPALPGDAEPAGATPPRDGSGTRRERSRGGEPRSRRSPRPVRAAGTRGEARRTARAADAAPAAWDLDADWDAGADRTEPLPRPADSPAARTEPLPGAGEAEAAPTEPLPGAGEAGSTRIEPRPWLENLPRPEPDDPPTMQIPLRTRRARPPLD